MNPLALEILSFLKAEKNTIFLQCEKKMIEFSDPITSTLFKENGLFFLEVIGKAITLEDENLDTYLQNLSKQLIKNYISPDTKIEHLVFNINMGKTILFKEIFDSMEINKGTVEAYDRIASVIDQFLFFLLHSLSAKSEQAAASNQEYIQESHEERLTLLGQMTSSFVHEFRNPLTTVHGFIQLLRAEHPDLPYMDIISDELEQLKYRITQFLTLSKREQFQQDSSIFSMNGLVEQVIEFIYPRLLEVNVELNVNLEDNLLVFGQKDEIRQVLINIIFNALEVLAASPAHPSVIYIEGYRDGKEIHLKTANPGPQIPDDLMAKIFEPFVTNKKTGTGLGLYVSKDIITKHRGRLICESDEKLTSFTIILPEAESYGAG